MRTTNRLVMVLGFVATTGFWTAPAAAQVARFDDHRVVRVQVADEQQLELLRTLTDDVWSENIGFGGPLDVRVSPEQFALLQNSGLEFAVLIENVQAIIDEQAAQGGVAGNDPFNEYLSYADITAYMNALAALRPDLAQVISIGKTLENRDIWCLRITSPGGGTKPGVLYHGCEHAREWITVPVCLYVADQLIRKYDTDSYLHELVDRAEWFIIPIFNADGYVYTWTNNRMWRKNRRSTYGVDINRNWGYQWGGEGASNSTSDETYRGSAPFSEPETQAMRDFFLAHSNIVTHNDLHSYSQLVLWPWGYTAALSPREAEFNAVGDAMAALLAQPYGTQFVAGPVYTTIYPASGVSVDWTYGVRGVLSYSYELRDTGNFGFLLPPEQILPSCIETLPALLYQADWATAIVRINYPGGLPQIIAPGQATTLPIQITAGTQSVDTNSATLHVRTSAGGSFSDYPIAYQGGSSFLATFPPRNCGDPTEFYVTVNGAGGGTSFSPSGAPDQLFSIPVGTLTTLFTDNFETDKGWTVQNQSVSTGAWVRVNPNGTSAQPEDDNPAGTGTLCYVTGQGSVGGGVGDADLDGGPTRLLSPVFALAGADPIISYYRWFYNDDGDDTLTVEVSNNNGGTWTTVETVTHNPAWTLHSFRVADFVAPTNTVRLRFSTSDNPNNSVTEAAVDDVTVFVVSCQNVPLKGDLNCDGTVDFFDIDAFVLAVTDPAGYQAAYPNCDINNADVNNDGVVDFFDIDPFIALIL